MPGLTSPSDLSFFATAPLNVEDLLEGEIRLAGGSPTRIHRTGIAFSGSLECAYRLCLWSRIASRILIERKRFALTAAGEIYKEVQAHPWEEEMEPSQTLAVEVSQRKNAIGENRFLALKVKDAVVDRLREKTGSRPSIDTEDPAIRIHLHIQENEAVLSLDLSGESLHRRGYRRETGSAPMKENTAAALLYRGGWDRLFPSGAPLVDPFCGSGTLLIEGALMASDTAPGLFRKNYGFTFWKNHRQKLWEKLLEEARRRRDGGMKKLPPIWGFDRDAQVVGAALENIRAAGLEGAVHVKKQEMGDLRPIDALERPGLLAANPPYGKRLEEESALVPLYRLFGETVKAHFPRWKGILLTSSADLAKATNLKAEKINTLYNGSLNCIAMAFSLFSREERRALAERELPALPPGARMFANRLEKNLKHRGKWARRRGITSYRLYDADMPEYAAALDFYEGTWVHLQEYAPPSTIPEEKAEARRRDILRAIPRVLKVEKRNIFFKTRERKRGRSQYEKADTRGEKFIINEGGLKFFVNFSDYLDSGIFLDHRNIRSMIRDRAGGKTFLNLFAYTGTATVYAAAAGARTTTVDASATYLAWAKENLKLNGLLGERQRFIQADCLEWLPREKSRYDLIFLDPPTFSNSKGRRTTFDVQRDQGTLLIQALALLAPGGTLVFSNNFRRFRLKEELLDGYEVEEITRRTVPEDFQRRGSIHRCWLIRKETGPEDRASGGAPPGK